MAKTSDSQKLEDAVLKRMLNTPPKHKTAPKKNPKKKKKK
jgi:hypothetical protein